MDALVRRGMLHRMKIIINIEPPGLSDYQKMYLDFIKGNKNISKKFIDVAYDNENIETDEDLWVAVLFLAKNSLKKFVNDNSDNRRKFNECIENNDMFDYISLKESVSIMMKRFQEEQLYFSLVKKFYNILISKTLNLHPLYFFALDKNMLAFLRTELDVNVSQFELDAAVYEIYKSKQFYLAGIHPSLYDSSNYVMETLLELNKNIEEFYNIRRKHSEIFLLSLGFKFNNAKMKNGSDVVDYPWFTYKFKQLENSEIEIYVDSDIKPYKTIYEMEIHYKVIEENESKLIQVRNYPVVDIENKNNEEYIENFLKYFRIK